MMLWPCPDPAQSKNGGMRCTISQPDHPSALKLCCEYGAQQAGAVDRQDVTVGSADAVSNCCCGPYCGFASDGPRVDRRARDTGEDSTRWDPRFWRHFRRCDSAMVKAIPANARRAGM